MIPTVLIVDDNANLTYFTAFSLKQEVARLEVVSAGSCEEALHQVVECNPSVCIVDLKLPDGDGLELIRDLRSRFPSMIPILITATPLPANQTKDLFGVLAKPYDPEALIELTRRALNSDDSWSGNALGSHRGVEPQLQSSQYYFHHVQNRLSGLLSGIRALRLELHAVAENPSEVRRITDEYADRLSTIVKDAAESLKRKADTR